MNIIKLDAIDSTNEYLKQLISNNLQQNYTVVTANFQTNGKGQMGSTWSSEAGKNLTMSKYTDVALGGSVGYKMYFNESIAMEVLVGYGYNLTNTEKSPDKISRVGINIGYRF